MFIIISPAKSLDFETPVTNNNATEVRFPDEAIRVVEELKKYDAPALSKLMKVSDSLAQLNHHRYQLWQYPFDNGNTRQALFAFKGDVYTGLDAYTLSEDDSQYAQKTLRMLSGLYGLLRPFDMIMPYRLEMGTKLTLGEHPHLYSFWDEKITDLLNEDMNTAGDEVLVNLASNEYFKAVKKKKLNKRIVTPVFKDWKNGQYKVISFFAKKARGLMTRFIIQNKLQNPEELLAFNEGGYYYNAELSKDDMPVFVRDHSE